MATKINTDNSFLGRGWSFPPTFQTHNKQVELVSDEEDIHQSLEILLSTIPGERIMNPDFGCELKTMVFEVITESMITKVQNAVERAILFFEPRINLEDVQVLINDDPLERDSVYDGVLFIHIDYMIRQINTRSNMVYPFYYIEGSNVSP